MSDPVRTERHGSTLVLTLDRPEVRNAVTRAMCETIAGALDDAAGDPDIRVVVVTGAGERAFCAGADLRDVTGAGIEPGSARERYGFGGFVRHPLEKPIIAAVNGDAVGGGAEMLLRVDLAVAAPHARIGFPEVARGVVSGGGGAMRLGRVVGPRLAADLLLTARLIEAPEAHAAGLLNELHADPLARALELAERIAANAPLAVAATLRLARLEREDWEANAREVAHVLASDDVAEGAAAFFERRPPRWTGR